MSRLPWDFDYELDLGAVAALADRCGLRGALTRLGAGWDYATYLCAGTVVRIPKRGATAALLAGENALLLQLPDDLTLATPRPRAALAAAIHATPGLPYDCMIYPLLEGQPLCDAPVIDISRTIDAAGIGTAVGTFLKRLHGCTPDAATPRRSDGSFNFTQWNRFALTALDELAPSLDASSSQRARIALRQSLPAITSRSVFSHQDLNDEHVLVDDAGHAVAIIDWGDAGYAPWWFDFTGLWMWGDDAALNAAFAAYGRSTDADERRWLQHHALLAAINELHHDVRTDAQSVAATESMRRLQCALAGV